MILPPHKKSMHPVDSVPATNLYIGIGLLVAATAITFYFLQDKQINTASDMSAIAATTTETAQARAVPDGWREYRNTAYRFSLLYPQELEIKEYPEEGNALSVTFQNVKEQKGFQIFVVPYEGAQVSEERFTQDLPSGIRIEVTDIAVDGAIGAAFYSKNALLGETREIWFVHKNFLFEVTTLKSLDSWLDDIMQTWKFI